MLVVRLFVVLGSLFWASGSAHAVVFSFDCITNNLAGDCAIGEAQLAVDVLDSGDGRALFVFTNVGADDAVITDVYFDDGTLLGLSGLIDADDDDLTPGVFGDAGVDFSPGASPGNLPGGNMIGFQATAGFLADSDAPPPAEGVGPGETLGVLFTLQSGGKLADVLDELDTGALRIGIHVQAFASGGSESFVNELPEPTAAV